MTNLSLAFEGPRIEAEQLIGTSVAVLGITGSGKSNTAAVLIEELLDNGFPLTIVDIESEYWGLKQKFDVLVAGRGEHADIQVGQEHAEALARLSARRRIPVILDVSEFSQDEMFEFLLAYFKALWAECSTLRQPYQVVLEEAHEFVPQGQRTPLKEILTRIALRGRKRGLAVVLISQRSPKVDKDLLTQAPLLFLHRVIHPVDLRVYEDLIPLPARQVDEQVTNLQAGQAVILFKNKPTVARIRPRTTFHAGATPTLGGMPQPELRKIDQTILDELRALTKEAGHDRPLVDDSPRIQALEKRVHELEAENLNLREKLKLALVAQPDPQPKPDAELAYLSERALKQRTNRQQQSFEYLVRDVLTLRAFQRRMLRFLVEREGRVFSLRDIAHGIDVSQSTIEGHGDTDLLQLGLIVRQGRGAARRYQSKACALFRQEYPLLNQDELRKTLLLKLLRQEVR